MSIFAQVPGITGGVSDKNFLGWISVDRLEWGSHRNITSNTSTKGDRESSNATITDLTFIKIMDRATPQIFLETCCGTGKTVKFVMTKTGAGDGADVFIEYTLYNALFMQMNTTHNGLRPVEKIKISFTSIAVKYITYDEDGNAKAPEIVGFNTATNTKI